MQFHINHINTHALVNNLKIFGPFFDLQSLCFFFSDSNEMAKIDLTLLLQNFDTVFYWKSAEQNKNDFEQVLSHLWYIAHENIRVITVRLRIELIWCELLLWFFCASCGEEYSMLYTEKDIVMWPSLLIACEPKTHK